MGSGKQVYFKLYEKERTMDQSNEMHHGAQKRDGRSNGKSDFGRTAVTEAYTVEGEYLFVPNHFYKLFLVEVLSPSFN